MHELSIAMGILGIASEEAEKWGGVKVRSIRLRLGILSGVVKEALLPAYDLALESFDDLAGTTLEIEEVPHFGASEADRPVVSIRRMICSFCCEPATRVVEGREIEVVALEIVE